MSRIPDIFDRESIRVREGLRALSARFRDCHARYFRATQTPEGGWPDRGGGADLYYTSFALRAADLLGIEDAEMWDAACAYLNGVAQRPSDVAQCHSWLAARTLLAARGLCAGPSRDWPLIQPVLERARAGSGYGHTARGPASVYVTFLAFRCCEMAGRETPGCAEAVDMIASRRNPDRGFGDCAGPSGLNATAAAVSFLKGNGALSPEMAEQAAAFIVTMRRDGGFAAHADAPEADLLSTFTAVFTLMSLGALKQARPADVARFVKVTACRAGGFRATPAETEPDAEYTFYGLATLGMLGAVAPLPSS